MDDHEHTYVVVIKGTDQYPDVFECLGCTARRTYRPDELAKLDMVELGVVGSVSEGDKDAAERPSNRPDTARSDSYTGV